VADFEVVAPIVITFEPFGRQCLEEQAGAERADEGNRSTTAKRIGCRDRRSTNDMGPPFQVAPKGIKAHDIQCGIQGSTRTFVHDTHAMPLANPGHLQLKEPS